MAFTKDWVVVMVRNEPGSTLSSKFIPGLQYRQNIQLINIGKLVNKCTSIVNREVFSNLFDGERHARKSSLSS